jgi:hypothetical protein
MSVPHNPPTSEDISEINVMELSIKRSIKLKEVFSFYFD